MCHRTRFTIVNGRRTETVIEQYYFQYRLTALSPGQHTIPAATLTLDGRTYRTEPIAITVVEPTEHQDFKLRLTLEKERVYIGEPVRLATDLVLAARTCAGLHSPCRCPVRSRPAIRRPRPMPGKACSVASTWRCRSWGARSRRVEGRAR